MEQKAELITLTPGLQNGEALMRGAKRLREGGLVAFPTETVYGLGADAANEKAVAAIYEAKGRPSFNPLIVHVANASTLSWYVEMTRAAEALAAAFMPGALTLVLPRKKNAGLSWLLSAGMDTLAIRVPSHPVAQALIKMADRPIAAPSANASGSISPTTPLHVMESLGTRDILVLGAGRCPIGVESTILDMTGSTPTLLRPGGVTKEQIEGMIGPITAQTIVNEQNPSSPGQLESHYAPRASVRLQANAAEADEAFLLFGPEMGMMGGTKRLNLSPKGDLHEAAANLFAMLRELDASGARSIAVMPIPETGLGLAINDRLRRAAAPRGKAAA